jgi:hypothetical protein
MRHLTRKRKANKKIIRRDTKATVQRYKVWNKEEIISLSKKKKKRGNNIFQGSLKILKAHIIPLPPNSPKNASGHHFPHRSTKEIQLTFTKKCPKIIKINFFANKMNHILFIIHKKLKNSLLGPMELLN